MQSHSDLDEFIGMEAGFKMVGLVETLLHLTPHFKSPALLILAQTLPLPRFHAPFSLSFTSYIVYLYLVDLPPLGTERNTPQKNPKGSQMNSPRIPTVHPEVSLTPSTQQKFNKEL